MEKELTPDELFVLNMKRFIELAAEDGKITEDEHNILKTIEVSLAEFTEKLKEALDDGIISPEEVDILKKFKAQMLKDAFDVANLDNKLTIDELKILMTLAVSVNLPDVTKTK